MSHMKIDFPDIWEKFSEKKKQDYDEWYNKHHKKNDEDQEIRVNTMQKEFECIHCVSYSSQKND